MPVQPELIEAPKTLAVQQAPSEASAMIAMIERVAANPDVNVDKLERLLAMQKDVMRIQAKAAFDGAFARMQSELPEITERGQIRVRGELRSTYARLEDIHAAIKPVLRDHGFAIRHRTEWPQERAGIIRIVGVLSHEHGHSEESVFEAPMDRSDYRTDIQSMGSTVSYGRRYTTLDLLNISTRGNDNDGQAVKPKREDPAGFGDWLADMASVADTGLTALNAAWNKSSTDYRNHILATDKDGWDRLKAKARDVDAKARVSK